MTEPTFCWDPDKRILITHCDDDVRVVENVRGHDTSRTVELGVVSGWRGEVEVLTDLNRELRASLDPDPFGPLPMWRPTPPCGRVECPCAVPNVPCTEFMGSDETGPWCPCCGWNAAAHDVSRRARRERVQRWREGRGAVASIKQIRSGLFSGQWTASCGPRAHRYPTHEFAVLAANAMAANVRRQSAGLTAETVRVASTRRYAA